MNAALSLQQAMRAALLADGALTTLLGGAHVYDEAPRGAKAPLLVFENIETRDWSTSDAKAHEHFVQLQVATGERGRAQARQAWIAELHQPSPASATVATPTSSAPARRAASTTRISFSAGTWSSVMTSTDFWVMPFN